jgi:hypothetical protein
LEALEALANQVDDAPIRGERTRDTAIDEVSDQSAAEESFDAL